MGKKIIKRNTEYPFDEPIYPSYRRLYDVKNTYINNDYVFRGLAAGELLVTGDMTFKRDTSMDHSYGDYPTKDESSYGIHFWNDSEVDIFSHKQYYDEDDVTEKLYKIYVDQEGHIRKKEELVISFGGSVPENGKDGDIHLTLAD